MLYSLGKSTPQVGQNVYQAPGSHIIGDVVLADNVSIWFNAVLRGDCDTLQIGQGSNIQDGAVLHTDPGVKLIVGQGVTIGHNVMLHGCEIGDFSLVGINAVILNGAKIGRYCVIGANTLITENTHIPDGSLVVGSPGKVVKTLADTQQKMLEVSSEHYQQNAKRFELELTAVEE